MKGMFMVHILFKNSIELSCYFLYFVHQKNGGKYSPFMTLDNSHEIDSTLDTDMVEVINTIEKEQFERRIRNREDTEEEDSHAHNELICQTQSLEILDDNLLQHLTQLKISQADKDISITFSKYVDKARIMSLSDIVSYREREGTQRDMLPVTNTRVIHIYKKMAVFLSQYHTGIIPKSFQVIPYLSNWVDILFLTSPTTWTSQATYEATKIFMSHIKAKQIQQFFQYVLLERVRSNINSNNGQYMDIPLSAAVMKGLTCYGQFLRGFLIPLCESDNFNMNEATLIGAILAQINLSGLHAATTLLYLSQIPFTVPSCLFILIFLEKKENLPFRVIHLLVQYFIELMDEVRDLPLIWYQALYSFVDSYVIEMVNEQKLGLLKLACIKSHLTDNISASIQQLLLSNMS
ncbi:Bystin-domain-containing protein [Pilobolus umbonatus]|nr:Bystin-domain-containing protein [Pilobolus umbonatus]